MKKLYSFPLSAWFNEPPFSWLRCPRIALRSGALGLLLLLSACEKPELEHEMGTAATSGTALASQGKDNPFTVEVMRKALKNLQSKKADGGLTTMSTLAPTHNYVRFKPVDTDQLADLEASGIQLSFEPLDETVAASTTVNYSSDEIPWVYSAVPYGVEVPDYIQREQLASLYLFNEEDGDRQDEDPWQPDPTPVDPPCERRWDQTCQCWLECVQQIAPSKPKPNAIRDATEQLKKAGVSPLALYNEAMRLTGHEDEMIVKPAPGEISIQSTRYYPSGTIRVQDTDLNADVPLRRVNVIARRWFNMDHDTYTNDNGYFATSKSYAAKVKIIVQFKNVLATTRGYTNTMKPWDIVLPIRYETGSYEKGQMQGMSHTFRYSTDAHSKGALSWVAATTFNALVDAYTFSVNRGLPAPAQGINIWLSSNITVNAATPMLRRVAATSNVSKALDLLLIGNPQVLAIKKVIQRQLPDITCRYGSGSNAPRGSASLNATFYHELGHTQHYNQVGNNFWTAYIAYVLTYGNSNNPYGQKTDPGASRIALSEAWGNYTERLFLNDKYQGTSRANIAAIAINELENQVPADNPSEQWIVYGLLHDMTDVGETVPTVVDNVNAFSPATVFRGLQPQATSVREYEDVIRVQNNSLQAFQMGQLVTSYRW